MNDASCKPLNAMVDKLARGHLVVGLDVGGLDPVNAVGLVNSNGWQVGGEVAPIRPSVFCGSGSAARRESGRSKP